MKVRLSENFRAVFYAPYYAAQTLGYYAREGVEVELWTSDAPGDAVPQLLDGRLDLTWGGPMRVMKARDLDPSSPLVSFGELVSHDPFFLIGKRKDFRLTDLPSLRFASVSEVPTPWMCFQLDLREAGLDPATLPRIANRSMGENYTALRAGDIDVMQAFEPFVSMAQQDGAGDVLYAATSRGPTSYTAFIATRDGVSRHREAFAAMVRALARLEQWIYGDPDSPRAMAQAVTTFFPGVPLDLLVRSLTRYRDAGLWSRDPTLLRSGFDRLGASFVTGGALTRAPVYEECVEPTL
jgi:NitT/TauT family transport system substrate-binding protein